MGRGGLRHVRQEATKPRAPRIAEDRLGRADLDHGVIVGLSPIVPTTVAEGISGGSSNGRPRPAFEPGRYISPGASATAASQAVLPDLLGQ